MRTAVSTDAARALAFGPFTFDRASQLLWKDGVEVPLPPRVLGVLSLLIDRPGQLVTKQELISSVWREAFVTETSLAEAISVLRQTLGDDPQQPTYVQTLHRRGYRFIASVRGGPVLAAAPELTARVETTPVAEPEPRLSLLVPWIVALFALLTGGAAVWRYVDTAPPPQRTPVRFALTLPLGLTVAPGGGSIAISSDGSLLALAACKETCAIYLRPLSQVEPTLVAGTTGAAAPFFSPDGKSLGYFANGGLYTIALAGGSPVRVAEAPEALGAAWLRSGEIVFARSAGEGLFIRARGDAARLTVPSSGDGGHHWPAALPDESGVVFTAGTPGQRYAALLSLRTRTWGRLLDDVVGARVQIPNYLIAQRGADLVATAFDGRAHSVAGLPVAVARAESAQDAPQFAVSPVGALVVARPGDTTLNIVLDWSGELRRLVPPPQPPLPR